VLGAGCWVLGRRTKNPEPIGKKRIFEIRISFKGTGYAV